MSLPQTIEHKGVVQNVRERGVTVRVMQSSACSSCAAARMCRSGESRERLIDVATKHASECRVGEPVVLVATAQQSRMAVMLAYVLPLFLLLAALFVVRGLAGNDGLAALSGAFAAMYNGFADVGSGTGIIVSGLASLMLGEFIIRSNKIGFQTLRVLLGSIIYRALMLVARRYGHYIHLTANDLKLITGFLIIASLIVANFKGKSNFARHLKRPAKDGSVENLCEKSVSGGAK